MFKKKSEQLPVKPEDKPEEKIEEIEIEDEEDDVVEESKEEEPKKSKEIISIPKESQYTVGDIIPVEQVAGYQVIKSISKDGVPSVISTDKISEAEILSFIYKK